MSTCQLGDKDSKNGNNMILCNKNITLRMDPVCNCFLYLQKSNINYFE